jgi:hypothetical protein
MSNLHPSQIRWPLHQQRVLNNKLWHYSRFNSLEDHRQFSQATGLRLSDTNAKRIRRVEEEADYEINNDPDWFGHHFHPRTREGLEKHHEFKNVEALQRVEKEIRGMMAEVEQIVSTPLVPQKKITYNEMGFGIFSFDRAAMGLFKLYWSPVHGRNFPQQDVERISEPGQREAYVLRSDNSPIEVKYRSSIKKVYAYHEPVERQVKGYSFYIESGANALIKADDMIYHGMSLCILAEYLMQMGYSVEINVLIGGVIDDENYAAFSVITLKKYQDFLDKNLVLLTICDPAWFRYHGFKAIAYAFNHHDKDLPAGFGKQASGNAIRSFAQGIINDPSIKPIVFAPAYKLQNAAKQILSIIKQVKIEEAKSAAWSEDDEFKDLS